MKHFLVILLLAIPTSVAWGQSASTTTPEGQSVLVQKNLGTQRWAIVRDQETRTITGNIFTQGGGAQFVWCEYLGEESYRCVGNSGCDSEPCEWAAIATVQIPESFFVVRTDGPPPTPAPTPEPTPRATPRPTAKPTAKPTPPPQSGLEGLLGTWRFSYSIGSSPFTDTIRLQRLRTVQGTTFVVGLNQFDRTVVGGALDDVFSSSSLVTDWAVIAFGSVICEAYAFDRSGDSASGKYLLASVDSNGDCGGFRGGYSLSGVRTSRTAADGGGASALSKDRAERRMQRARRVEDREARRERSLQSDGALEAAVGRLAHSLRAAAIEGAAVSPDGE